MGLFLEVMSPKQAVNNLTWRDCTEMERRGKELKMVLMPIKTGMTKIWISPGLQNISVQDPEQGPSRMKVLLCSS